MTTMAGMLFAFHTIQENW